MTRRSTSVIVAFGVLCVMQSLSAQRPAPAAPAGLVGTWTLSSVDQHVGNAAEATRIANPRGLLVYDAAGHALEIVTHAGRAPYAANQPTPAEAHVTFDNYAGFWGGYRVDERAGQIVYRPEGAVNPNIMGQELPRSYELKGDQPHGDGARDRTECPRRHPLDLGARPAGREPVADVSEGGGLLATRGGETRQPDDRCFDL